MIDFKLIRSNPELVRAGAKKKKTEVDVDLILKIDKSHREVLQKLEGLRAKQNQINKSAKGAKPGEGEIKVAREIKSQLDKLEIREKELKDKLDKLLLTIPNLPMDDVPEGKDEGENVVLREIGQKPVFDFEPKSYLEIAEKLDWIDTERASKVSGSRFGYLKNKAALLEFALVSYVFSILTNGEVLSSIANGVEPNYSSKPFIPVVPPAMIKPEVFKKMARLDPGQEEERYYLPKDDLYLIGSAEHTLGPLHMDEILREEDLPLRYIGFSSSFRREAGSYGKDTKGIIRVHQFDKLEMESFTLPEDSVKEQNFIVAIQEHLMRSLGLPYRVMMICAGDMGGPDARQLDLEVWLPSENRYRETHTSDLMTDYQSRRLNTRVRRHNGELQFVHMNDATAFAIGRTIVAIIENYQQADGSVEMPEVLKKYLP